MGPRQSKALGLAWVSMALMGGIAVPAIGDDPQNDLGSLVALLDSPDLAARENAALRLSRRGDMDLRAVEDLLATSSELSPEQRTRLYTLGRQIFVRSTRAGMGIQFGQGLDTGVQVSSTVTGFDAQRQLRPMDILVKIGGEPVTSREQISAEILSREPGETMDLTIIRGTRTIDVALKMGSYADLHGGQSVPIPPDALQRAWLYRLGRRGLSDPMDGEPALAPGADSLSGTFTALLNMQTGRTGIRPEARSVESWLVNSTVGLAGGGIARGGVDRFDRPRTRIGTVDAWLPSGEPVADILEGNLGDQKYALMLDAMLFKQRRLGALERDYQIRVRRAGDPQEQAKLGDLERRLDLASRTLGRWYRTWLELDDAGMLGN